jgi:type IV fimbrial biogenesis protein FimT
MRRRQKGLTLIELMVTLAVAIVLLAVGIPAFRSLEVNDRVTSQVNALVNALNLARIEAISGSAPVSVCAANGPAVDTCGGLVWANGWLVFTDGAGAAGAYEKNLGDGLLRREGPLTGKPVVSSPKNYVQFDGRGERADLSGKKVTNLDFVIAKLDQQGSSAGRARWVCVNLAGQIRAESADRGNDQCK